MIYKIEQSHHVLDREKQGRISDENDVFVVITNSCAYGMGNVAKLGGFLRERVSHPKSCV